MGKNSILEIKGNFDLMKKTVSKLPQCWQYFREHIDNILIIIGLLLVVLAVAVAVEVPENIVICLQELLGLSEKDEVLKFIGFCIAGVVSIWLALSADKRANAMDSTAKNTEEGQRQERLKNAIEHLGHKRDSVRMGGTYELFHLAKDTRNLRQTVMDILCAHIRQMTRGNEYKEKHEAEPSEEIQSLLTLLFREEHDVFKGCSINLQGSYLNGANLSKARLKKANLIETQLQDTNLCRAQLQKANLLVVQMQGAFLRLAQLQGAVLKQAQLQGADLAATKLQEADLVATQLQGANLTVTQLQGADLMDAQLQGADLVAAKLQGADLTATQLQGTDFGLAQLQGANLSKAQLQGADLMDAQLRGAKFSKAQLQGVSSQEADHLPSVGFESRIRNRIGKPSDLKGIIFVGGLQPEDLDTLCEDLSAEKAQALREKLRPPVGPSASNKLPPDSGAETGTYTQEEAEQWIVEYQEAMREVPKRDNS